MQCSPAEHRSVEAMQQQDCRCFWSIRPCVLVVQVHTIHLYPAGIRITQLLWGYRVLERLWWTHHKRLHQICNPWKSVAHLRQHSHIMYSRKYELCLLGDTCWSVHMFPSKSALEL